MQLHGSHGLAASSFSYLPPSCALSPYDLGYINRAEDSVTFVFMVLLILIFLQICNLVVSHLFVFARSQVHVSSWRPAILNVFFYGFPQSLETNAYRNSTLN
jgi:hypothetical protein